MVSNKKMSSKSKGKTIGTYLKLVDSLVKQSSYMHVNAGMILWKTRFLQIKLNNSACQCASKYYVLKILPTEHHLKQISKQKYLSICKDLHLSTRGGSRDAGASKRSILDVAEP